MYKNKNIKDFMKILTNNFSRILKMFLNIIIFIGMFGYS